jgi:hypothetical protein
MERESGGGEKEGAGQIHMKVPDAIPVDHHTNITDKTDLSGNRQVPQ